MSSIYSRKAHIFWNFFFTSQLQGTFLGYNNILTSKKNPVIINRSILQQKSYFGTTQIIWFPTFLGKIRRPGMSKKLIGRNNVKKSQIQKTGKELT